MEELSAGATFSWNSRYNSQLKGFHFIEERHQCCNITAISAIDDSFTACNHFEDKREFPEFITESRILS